MSSSLIGKVDWKLFRKGVGLGLIGTITVVVCFWSAFLFSLTALWLVRWFYKPPPAEHFPVRLDYNAFVEDFLRPGELNNSLGSSFVSGSSSLFSSNRTYFRIRNIPPRFESDDIIQRGERPRSVPRSIVGFTDLMLNVSGIERQKTRWSRLLAQKYFPLDISLMFLYNNDGFCASIDDPTEEDCEPKRHGWLSVPPAQAIDVNGIFYAQDGAELLKTVTTFFPNLAPSKLQYALRSLWAPRSGGWQLAELTLFQRVVLPTVESLRYFKLCISPKLPIQDLVVEFRPSTVPARFLNSHPKILSITLALIIAICATLLCSAMVVIIAIAVVMTHFKQKQN